DVKVSIYTLNGQLISERVHSNQMPGKHSIELQTTNLSNGTYLVTAKGKNLNAAQKLVVLR
ncbi:MAG TPA: T9SS type A sorting domain-containing protein, partial [Chitinophagales bacterium]|nr:T9SS type A sorting domain-containing protein [Chitinophagales bacterium]